MTKVGLVSLDTDKFVYLFHLVIFNRDACGQRRVMCFREKLVMDVELSEHVNVINVFHDVNSNSYTVTSIHHMAGFLLKVGNVF